ncbi:MAG TPA: hypothetical protein DIT07_09685, partial [Sphingobacteriaceae bacterium]|nr:hypothetical protein [Sphingobacteriaceae bacterium]
RVFLEKVKGEYQGASFLFRTGFNAGVFRMAWGKDGSLFIGETSRGWGSSGDANEGLQRVVWNNVVPFEMRAVRAMPDGFEIEFTNPVDQASAENLASYNVESFIYKYHPVYGSPPVNQMKCKVLGVKLSADGLKARIIVDNLRQSYIHTLTLDGVREKGTANSLLHPTAYYTLNNIPDGQKLSMSEVSTRNVVAAPIVATSSGAASTAKAAYDAVKGLLIGYTCSSCHNATMRQVGPSFTDVANKKYSNEQIVDLIHNPQPLHWPDFATPMTPMPQVSSADALKIAGWINSLAK